MPASERPGADEFERSQRPAGTVQGLEDGAHRLERRSLGKHGDRERVLHQGIDAGVLDLPEEVAHPLTVIVIPARHNGVAPPGCAEIADRGQRHHQVRAWASMLSSGPRARR